MKYQRSITGLLIAAVVFALCGIPEAAMAYAQAPAQQEQQSPGSVDQQQQPASQPLGTDPSVPAQPGTQPATPTNAPDATAQQPTQQPGQTGTTIDPAQGPLTPVPTGELPEAPSATAPQGQPAAQQPATAPAGQQPQPTREPLGAAAAEGINTAGGGASRPAGAAIAPAKQRQVRSFLIKLGAIAAAGAAIGTIYALSKGTPSTPPNSGR